MEELTPREQEVVDALVSIPFRSPTEIAKDLGISTRTFRQHVSNVLGKLGKVDQRHLAIDVLHERLSLKGTTKISRRGGRRRAVVVLEAVMPVDIPTAVDSLSTSGAAVYVLTSHVEEVLDRLDVFDS